MRDERGEVLGYRRVAKSAWSSRLSSITAPPTLFRLVEDPQLSHTLLSPQELKKTLPWKKFKPHREDPFPPQVGDLKKQRKKWQMPSRSLKLCRANLPHWATTLRKLSKAQRR
jgi:hypothetical protein